MKPPFLDWAYHVTLSILTIFFVYLFLGSVSRALLEYATGQPLGTVPHSWIPLLRKKGTLETTQQVVRGLLKQGRLSPVERVQLEEEKRILEKRLTEKPLDDGTHKEFKHFSEQIDKELLKIEEFHQENQQYVKKLLLVQIGLLWFLAFLGILFAYCIPISPLKYGIVIGSIVTIVTTFPLLRNYLALLLLSGSVLGLLFLVAVSHRLSNRL